MLECDVCSAKVSETRRGRCWGCYNRWAELKPVGVGARCVVCGERRRRVLRSIELLGTWQPACFNCHGQVLALDSVPATVADIRATLERERRRCDRRVGKADSRVFRYERRVGQRRGPAGPDAASEWATIDDDMIVEIVLDDGQADAASADFEEMTRIHIMPL